MKFWLIITLTLLLLFNYRSILKGQNILNINKVNQSKNKFADSQIKINPSHNSKDIITSKNIRKESPFKPKTKILFVDNYFPVKYVQTFFKQLMDNFEFHNEKYKLQIIKSLLICNNKKTDQNLKFVPKEPFDNIESNLKESAKNINTNYSNLLKSIIENFEKMAKVLNKVCTGLDNFIILLKNKLNLLQNKKEKLLPSKNNFRKKINKLLYSLQVHNFENSGKLIGKLINEL